VLGRIGDEQHCKPQTSVVVARPLPFEDGEAAAAVDGNGWQERPGPEPGTPPFHPWRQQQQQQQRGRGEREEGAGGEKVAIKVGGW
jgi:hypothetical protein